MSITRSANHRDRPWDDNWNNLDDSNQGWADMGQIGLDDEHTARHDGGTSAESAAGPGHEVRNGSSDADEARDVVEDEHQGLVDDDPEEGENHEANAHEPRDGPGSGPDQQGLPGDDHAHAGQGGDAHDAQDGTGEHPGQVAAAPDNADDDLDEDEDHGANGHEARDGPGRDHQGLPGDDHAHAGQGGDAHDAQDGTGEHPGQVAAAPDNADDDLDEDEDHGANGHEARDGHVHHRQGSDDDDHAHARQGGNGHEAQDGTGAHPGQVAAAPDNADDDLDEGEDHGANGHETRDGHGHHRQGLDDDEHGSHQAVNDSGKDRSDGHRGSLGADTAWGDGADTFVWSDIFVWSDTFKQCVGVNHASVDEGHQPEMSAFSEDSAVDQGGDLHCDANMPDMTHNSVIPVGGMDHWLV